MFSRSRLFLVVLLWAGTLGCEAKSAEGRHLPWWKTAVIYQLYPRSFADSNGDGIGDLNGIRAHLDYLQALGVDAIWINPCYPSPLIDSGYDITDFKAIDPQYGTLADFDRLVADARKRGIRVLMDFVPDHTSDRHPWFVQSSTNRANPKRDWYIWADGVGTNPPNNWQSFDPETKSAWQFNPRRNQFYYHMFDHRQPNLNWRNPGVERAMLDAMRFWLRRGVAGFRLDAVNYMYVDDRLRDNPPPAGPTDDTTAHGRNTWNRPEYHRTIRRIRRMVDQFHGNRVLIGETNAQSMGNILSMYGSHHDELQLPMNFNLFWCAFNATDYRREVNAWEMQHKGWPLLFFSNHDFPRSYSRLGDRVNDDAIARVLATLLLTLRGTPIVYYGEELGMSNADLEEIRSKREQSGGLRQPPFDRRDAVRTPMQWDATANAGFSAATPWLPVEANFQGTNAASEESQPASLLRLYRHLIALRRSQQPLREGTFTPLFMGEPSSASSTLLAYLRSSGDRKIAIVLNISAHEQTTHLLLRDKTVRLKESGILLAESASISGGGSSMVKLGPFGILIVCADEAR